MNRVYRYHAGPEHQSGQAGQEDGAFRDGDGRSQGCGDPESCCSRDGFVGQQEQLTRMVRKAYGLIWKKAEEARRHFRDPGEEVDSR